MIETDSRGAPVQVEDLDADWLLALAEDAETQSRVAERRKLRLALQWCVLHPATDGNGPATWSEAGVPEVLDRDETIGGDGTPSVGAFTAEPLAAALQISPHAALRLMADALNLAHRLPRTWAAVESLSVPAWRARRIAQATASLSRQVAAHVDSALAGRVGSCGVATLDRLVAEAAALFDPDQLGEAEDDARASWGVRINHGQAVGGYAGTSWLDATGDDDPLEIRKAKALGLITDRALGLATPDTRTDPWDGPGARTHLYLHTTLADLTPPTGQTDTTAVGRVERLGPATVARIRESVVLRDPHCVFPWCQHDSGSCDLDHIDPYDDTGPPGQTHPENLAPLCRRHHRAKTAGRWRYARDTDHTYTWHSPPAAPTSSPPPAPTPSADGRAGWPVFKGLRPC